MYTFRVNVLTMSKNVIENDTTMTILVYKTSFHQGCIFCLIIEENTGSDHFATVMDCSRLIVFLKLV